MNGQAESCTELACFTMNRAKCLDHTFVYLTETHEQFITQAINAYLDRAADRVVAEKNLLAKVTEKRDEINNILMVSTFPV
jgi:flavoprotein